MKKAIRVFAIMLVVLFLGALAMYNNGSGSTAHKPWNEQMALGNLEESQHFFVEYTDVFCPYCNKFANALSANMDEFRTDYVEGEKVFFEARITDMIYEFHKNESDSALNSRYGAEAVYCAADQNQFWPYYDALLEKIYNRYYSKGIGVDQKSEHIPLLELDFFTHIADKNEAIDAERFSDCLHNHEKAEIVDKNTARAGIAMQNLNSNGVPVYVFDSFTYNGFVGTWDAEGADWKNARTLFDAGLASKKN